MTELTPMEKRILKILCDPNETAQTSKEIGEKVHISGLAVNQHFKRIYKKFGVKRSKGLFRHIPMIVEQLNRPYFNSAFDYEMGRFKRVQENVVVSNPQLSVRRKDVFL